MTSFADTPVDWGAELQQALDLMGKRSTDLERLTSVVGLLYLNCPDEYRDRFGLTFQLVAQRYLFTLRHPQEL